MTEKESATFVCEVSHDEVEAQWHKGDAKVKAGDNIKIRQEGELNKMQPSMAVNKMFTKCKRKSQLQEGQINGSQTHLIFSVLGKTYILLFKSVKAEDAGEIKFTAEKASSAAKLKVKGSLLCLSYLHAFCI